MERRIKLTDEDLEIIAAALDGEIDSAIDAERGEAYIDKVIRLRDEFQSRIPEEDE